VVQFSDWCSASDSTVNNHFLRVITADNDKLAIGVEAVAEIIPTHYASEEHLAHVLDRLGKSAAAELIRNKLPTTKKIRSGDFGEILSTEWINSQSEYLVPIKRLRWKDHQNMAMRGEDVIGLILDPGTNRLKFLKTEAKSRVSLSAQVVTEARSALDKDEGLPSPHALAFVSARLLENGETDLADAIDDAQLRHGIPQQNVLHLLFTFSGNSPEIYLASSLEDYDGSIAQWSVGIRVRAHAEFIKNVYEQVIKNAEND
jgi:hypothetical protein